MKARPFDSIVFAGGGNRSFWQLGFMGVAHEALDVSDLPISSVSAGAAMACAIRTGRGRATLDAFKQATSSNPRNFYPKRVLSKEPSFPHYAMYRDALSGLLGGTALDALRAGPPLYVSLTRPPRWLRDRSAMLIGSAAYEIEKRLHQPVHPRWALRIGFKLEVVDARTCATPEELAELILHSSCTPPFTPRMTRSGRAVLDGGVVDGVPVHAFPQPPENTLVLLTRKYRRGHPQREDRVYVEPSEPVPIHKMDYTNPFGVQRAYDLGRRDAERFLKARSLD